MVTSGGKVPQAAALPPDPSSSIPQAQRLGAGQAQEVSSEDGYATSQERVTYRLISTES